MQVAKLRPEHHGRQSFQVCLKQAAQVVTTFLSLRLCLSHSVLFPDPDPFPAVCLAMKPATCL